MNEIFDFMNDVSKRLHKPIKDLDDISSAMVALKELRDNEIRIDMTIGPIEVCPPTLLLLLLLLLLLSSSSSSVLFQATWSIEYKKKHWQTEQNKQNTDTLTHKNTEKKKKKKKKSEYM